MELTILESIGLQANDGLALTSAVKLLMLVFLMGYLAYAFLLTLRIRILSDTVKTRRNNFVKMITYLHLFMALTGTFLAVILVLLG